MDELESLKARITELENMNKNLSGGFITMMKDLRKFSRWIVMSHIGNTPLSQDQFNEAKSMGESIDQVAAAKGWNLEK
jgi:hypothetical protein